MGHVQGEQATKGKGEKLLALSSESVGSKRANGTRVAKSQSEGAGVQDREPLPSKGLKGEVRGEQLLNNATPLPRS